MKKEIKQYDKDGNLLGTFSSIKEASDLLGIKSNTISGSLDKMRLCLSSYYFQRDKELELLPEKYVQQFSQQGYLVKTFSSVKDAVLEYGEENITRHKINNCISEGNKSMSSYWTRGNEKITEEDFQKQKIVSVIEQSDIYGKKVRMFWNEYDVERKLGIPRANISSATLGRSKTAAKYVWTRMKMSLYELNQYLTDNNIAF